MSTTNLCKYASIVFDCDGVILNSNPIKTEAFYQCALPWGYQAAETFVKYHKENGGISRYKKFAYLIDNILSNLPNSLISKNKPNINKLLLNYADYVTKQLLNCEIASSLHQVRSLTPNSSWSVASGSDQAELRYIFEEREISNLFDAGVYGSPDTKEEILNRNLESHIIKSPTLFIGDSVYDFKVSNRFNLDFLFVSEWTELPNWQLFTYNNNICTANSLNELIQ